MNWLNDDSDDILDFQRMVERDRSGPCDDDVEVTCPYVDMLPDESDHEEGSPLNFNYYNY